MHRNHEPRDCCEHTWYISSTERIAVDAAGAMPETTYSGALYVYVMLHVNTGYIRLIPFKSRSQISEVLVALYLELVRLGHQVSEIITDNEFSSYTSNYFNTRSVVIKKVAPYMHRANPYEGVSHAHHIPPHFTANNLFISKFREKFH